MPTVVEKAAGARPHSTALGLSYAEWPFCVSARMSRALPQTEVVTDGGLCSLTVRRSTQFLQKHFRSCRRSTEQTEEVCGAWRIAIRTSIFFQLCSLLPSAPPASHSHKAREYQKDPRDVEEGFGAMSELSLSSGCCLAF